MSDVKHRIVLELTEEAWRVVEAQATRNRRKHVGRQVSYLLDLAVGMARPLSPDPRIYRIEEQLHGLMADPAPPPGRLLAFPTRRA